MKKKQIANAVMAAVIVLIAAAGVLGVGLLRGWFDKADGTQAALTEIQGSVTLQRGGVSFPVQGDTVLHSGDRLSAGSGATAVIRIGSDSVTLGSKAELTVSEPAADRFAASVDAGELFVSPRSPLRLSLDGREFPFCETAAAVSVRSGAQSISVFSGTVGRASAGQILEFTGGTETLSSLKITSLNEFVIQQIRIANRTSQLCFSDEDLDRLAESRRQELQELINGAASSAEPSHSSEAASSETASPEPASSAAASSSAGQPDSSEPAPSSGAVSSVSPSGSSSHAASSPAGSVPPEAPSSVPVSSGEPAGKIAGSVYLTIRCDTILEHMDELTPGKAEFVPADGVILPAVKVDFYEGETVFQILQRTCSAAGIQLEYSWTPLYNSYYIEGINHLYEFDCGENSGWMYQVNGWFPNYGCSGYEAGDGDVIVWCYTCQGLGTDVGAPGWEE